MAQSTTDPAHTDRILCQGKALVRAIEALPTIAPSGPTGRAAARRLLAAYNRRLRGVVEVAPNCVTEETLSASGRVGDTRAVFDRLRTGHAPGTLAGASQQESRFQV
jgi:hypothetical protein